VGEQVEVLEHHADLAAHPAQMRSSAGTRAPFFFHVRERLAVDPDDALVDALQRHQHAQHRGLARSRGADDRHLLVARDVEIELVEHGQRPVALGDRRSGPSACLVASSRGVSG
jgi:hypothetical protein